MSGDGERLVEHILAGRQGPAEIMVNVRRPDGQVFNVPVLVGILMMLESVDAHLAEIERTLGEREGEQA